MFDSFRCRFRTDRSSPIDVFDQCIQELGDKKIEIYGLFRLDIIITLWANRLVWIEVDGEYDESISLFNNYFVTFNYGGDMFDVNIGALPEDIQLSDLLLIILSSDNLLSELGLGTEDMHSENGRWFIYISLLRGHLNFYLNRK
jgi:hypothetical protein